MDDCNGTPLCVCFRGSDYCGGMHQKTEGQMYAGWPGAGAYGLQCVCQSGVHQFSDVPSEPDGAVFLHGLPQTVHEGCLLGCVVSRSGLWTVHSPFLQSGVLRRQFRNDRFHGSQRYDCGGNASGAAFRSPDGPCELCSAGASGGGSGAAGRHRDGLALEFCILGQGHFPTDAASDGGTAEGADGYPGASGGIRRPGRYHGACRG